MDKRHYAFLTLTPSDREKFLALDDRQRLRFIDRMCPGLHMKTMTEGQKASVLQQVNGEVYQIKKSPEASDTVSVKPEDKEPSVTVVHDQALSVSMSNYENTMQLLSQSDSNTQTNSLQR